MADERQRSKSEEPEDFEGVTILGGQQDPNATPPPGRSVFADPIDLDDDLGDELDDVPDDELDLPHWTSPPTGSTPAVDDLDAWATITGSQPRWRETAADYDDDEPEFRFEDDPDAGDDFFDFEVDDELEEADEPVAAEVGAGGARGAERTAVQARTRRSDDLPVRVGTGLVLIAVAALAFRAGPAVVVVLVALILAVATAELFNATRRAGYQPAVLLGIVASGTLPLAIYWRGLEAVPLVMFLLTAFALLWFLAGAGRESPLLNAGVTVLGVVYVGLFGSFAALILQTWGSDGIGILLGAVTAAVAYDVGGFVVGRSAGKTPLTAVSPNKTVEGLFGGMIFAVVATTVVAAQIHPWGGAGDAFVLGMAAAIVAPLGDLCESMVKRDVGVKDMGSLLPGHGGLLDRFDALLFVLPVTYEVARWLDLGA